MTDSQIGVAVIGAGRWGAHLVRNFSQHPQATLLAVADPSLERLAFCREQFGLSEAVLLTQDWQDFQTCPAIEAIAVVTPAATHYEIIATALNQGYHVLAEKPLTLEVETSLALAALAEQQQRILLVDHTYLFNPAVARGREIVQAGQLGELRYGYASRTNLGPVRQDVDALWDLAIHDIAIFNTWLGATPDRVQSRGNGWLQPERKLGSQGLADVVWATLIYPSGFCAELHLCWLNPDKQRRLAVVGSQGTLVFDELAGPPLKLHRGYFEQPASQFLPAGLGCDAIEFVPAEPLGQLCDRFLAAIANPTATSIDDSSGWVGAELVQILTCLSQSLQQQGRIVTVPPLPPG